MPVSNFMVKTASTLRLPNAKSRLGRPGKLRQPSGPPPDTDYRGGALPVRVCVICLRTKCPHRS